MEEPPTPTWSITQSMGYYQIVCSPLSSLLGQQYTIPIHTLPSLSKELSTYRLRQHSSSQYLVKILDIQATQTDSLCSGPGSLKVITERIPHRLDEVERMSEREGVYVLERCLRGFREVGEMMEVGGVEERMVGIDREGVVKVWGNEDYSRNWAEGRNRGAGVGKEERVREVVRSIVDVVQRRAEGRLDEGLCQELRGVVSGDMDQHIRVIDRYLKQKGIDLTGMKVKVVKGEQEEQEEKRDMEGEIEDWPNDQSLNVIDQSSTQYIEGLPYPVAQLVHILFQGKIFKDEKKDEKKHEQEDQMHIKENIQTPEQKVDEDIQITIPQVSTVPQINIIPQINTPPPFPSQTPLKHNAMRPFSQPSSITPSNLETNCQPVVYPQIQNDKPRPRPISQRPTPQPPQSQQIHPPPQNYQLSQNYPLQNGCVAPPIGPYSPIPPSLQLNPNFPSQQTFPLQYPPQQQFNGTFENLNSQKKLPNMVQSECHPLRTPLPNQYHSLPAHLSPQQYQRMILQELNLRNRFNPMLNQPPFLPHQMFSPPQYLQQQQQYANSLIFAPPANADFLHNTPSLHQIQLLQQQQLQQQYLHNQMMMQNLQNNLARQGQQPPLYPPMFKRF